MNGGKRRTGCYFDGLKWFKGREVLYQGHWVPVCRHCYDEATAGRRWYAGSVQRAMPRREPVRRKPVTRKLTPEDKGRQLVLELGPSYP